MDEHPINFRLVIWLDVAHDGIPVGLTHDFGAALLLDGAANSGFPISAVIIVVARKSKRTTDNCMLCNILASR